MNVKTVLLLLIICFFVRALPAHFFYGTYDIYVAERQYEIVKDGNFMRLWTELGHPHSPVQAWYYYFAGILSGKVHLPFSTMAKILAIFSDLAITLVIYISMLRLGLDSRKSFLYGLFYALNPLIILITGLNGQFDSATILFSLLSWYFWQFGKERRLVYSAISLGIGIAIKEFPIFLYPLYLLRLKNNKERAVYTFNMLLPILMVIGLSFVFYTPKFIFWINKYKPTQGFWGFSLIFYFLEHRFGGLFILLNSISKEYGRFILIFLLLFIGIISRKQLSLLSAIVLVFSTLYFFTTGLSIQYLVWIVPFAILNRDKMIYLFTLFASVFTVIWFEPVFRGSLDFYSHGHLFNLIRNIFSIFTWVICGIWFIRLFRETDFLKLKGG